MLTFPPEIRELIYKACNGYCQIPGCTNFGTEFHHIKPNSKINNKKYPLFTQSPFNAFLICQAHHMNYSCFKWLNISDKLAEVYEQYLQSLIKGQ